jgi:hypothetical protein
MALVGTINAPNDFGMKNRIINGAMVIDQRNAGASLSLTGVSGFPVDRWNPVIRPTGGGTATGQQVSDAPTGFSNSLKLTVATADTSLAAQDYYFLWQKIEGFNSYDFLFGTANASSVTLSFWVKSSVTGQMSAFLQNSAESYTCPIAYTINAANTWEKKTITFSGATAGTWVGATNGAGLHVGFSLANGTGVQSTSGVWTASSVYGSTGDINWMATSGNTWQITGVQLEKGSTATSFDYRPYGTELALCQRYFWNAGLDAGNIYWWAHPIEGTTTYRRLAVRFPVNMRTAPTFTVAASTNGSFGGGMPNVGINGTQSCIISCDVTATNHFGYITTFTATAEL